MAQVNKYKDQAAYEADTDRLSTKSAVSFIESESAAIYDGVNIVVDKPSAGIGDLAVFDKTEGVIRYIKGATIVREQIPANLVPLAVVYARQGERLLVVSLGNAGDGNLRWAHPYEVALSGFDLAGGTIVLAIGAGSSIAADLSVTYAAGATLADIAAAVNAALKGGTPNYSSVDYGGWAATGAADAVIMASNTYNASCAAIAVVSGCEIRRTREDRSYQTTPTGVLIEGAEYVRQKNYVSSSHAGCNPERFLQHYSVSGSDQTGQKPGSNVIIRESVFTEEANPKLVAAYPTYRDCLIGEHMMQYPTAYGAVLRDGRENTAKIGGLRFIDICGRSAPCYPAAAAALDYGITVEGATTGLEAGAWWLPSVEEVNLLMRDRVLTSADLERDPVNRTLSRLGKTTCYGAGYYIWTSCEYYRSDAFIYNGVAGVICSGYKYGLNTVRPVSAL